MNDSPNNFTRSYGTNWTRENLRTLSEWISIAAYNIECLDLSASYYRTIIRNHTVAGLILSTLSGTLSITQFGITQPVLIMSLNGTFTVFSFVIAILTGWLKIYQIQEQLEIFIKLKQDWTLFSTRIASELQLPRELRRDALYLIIKYKNQYLDLLKSDAPIPESIRKLVVKDIKKSKASFNIDVSTLPHIMVDICEKTIEDIQTPLLTKSSNINAYTVESIEKENGIN